MKEQQHNGRYSDGEARLAADRGAIDSVLDRVTEVAKEGKDCMDKTVKETTHTFGDTAQYAKDEITKAGTQIADGVSRAVETSSEKLGEGITWGKKMLENSSVAKFSDEVTSLIKKYPLQSFLGAIVVGAWLGSKVNSSKSV